MSGTFTRKSLFFLFIFLFALIIFYGTLVRLEVFCNPRDFFSDEGSIFINIERRTFLQLFLPLDLAQCSPPLFSILSKIIYENFGFDEKALRFIPF